jgi:hypothetical protein
MNVNGNEGENATQTTADIYPPLPPQGQVVAVFASAERADLLVDFSDLERGSELPLLNDWRCRPSARLLRAGAHPGPERAKVRAGALLWT